MAVILIALLAMVRAWSYTCNTSSTPSYCGTDYFIFWAVAQDVRNKNTSNIFLESESKRLGEDWSKKASASSSPALKTASRDFPVLQPVSTPFLYSVFSIFVSGDYDKDSYYFYLISTGSFIIALAMIALYLGYGGWGVVLLFLMISLWYEPFKVELRVGNVERLQIVFWTICLYLLKEPDCRSKIFCAGLVCGLMTLFKPNTAFVPLLLLFHGLFRRQWRWLSDFTVGGLVASIMAVCHSALFFGDWRSWIDWLNAIQERFLTSFHISEGRGNLALFSLVEELVPEYSGQLSLIICFLLMAAVIGVIFLARKKNENDFTLFLTSSLGLILGVIFSKPLWMHYLLLTLPLTAFFFSPIWIQGINRGWMWKTAQGLAVFSLLISSGLIFPLMHQFEIYTFYTLASFVSFGLICLLIAGLLALLVPRPESYSTSDVRYQKK